MEAFRLLIVTGMSGAGKTQVLQALEDMGYLCIDNIPPVLIPKLNLSTRWGTYKSCSFSRRYSRW